MKIVVLHLSDVHFKDNVQNEVAERAKRIKSAIQLKLNGASVCFIVFTGDVAFAGKTAEYAIAERFLTELADELRSVRASLILRFVAVPGNHDCDFAYDSALRKITLNAGNNLKEELKPDDDSIVRTLTGVQDNFFTFLMKPSHPFVILSMLQMLESNVNPYAAPGVYGYFYEFFILQALSVHVTPVIPMNYVMAFTPMVAERMFALKRRSLSEAELNDVIDNYRTERDVNVPTSAMRAILLNSSTMRKEASGVYTFKHKYIYYYFLAKHLALSLHNQTREDDTRVLVSEMASKLYVEEFANIILFLVYLTGDERIIRQILAQAMAIYSEFDPCDLDGHMEFISRNQTKPVHLTLPASAPDQNRREHLRTIDDAERALDRKEDGEDDDRVEEERQLDEMLRINVSFKTLDMLGQILRNFPGDLSAELKFELARESYLLSLRTMRMLFKIIEDNAPEFRALLAEVIGRKRDLEGRELEDAADRFFFLLSLVIGLVFVKRVSEAVGSELLERTYAQILKETESAIAVPLIDLAIRLDHFHNFPEQEVRDLHKRTQDNIFAYGILRQLVTCTGEFDSNFSLTPNFDWSGR